MVDKKTTGASGAKGKKTQGTKKKAASSAKPKAQSAAGAKPDKAQAATSKPEAPKVESAVNKPETTVSQNREKTTAVPPARQGKKGVGTAIATMAGIVLVAVILIAVVVFLNLSAFSKAAVERIASDALGVAVTIDEMDVNLDEMSITVSGLTVANPEGFISPNAVEVGSMAIFAENLSPDLMVFDEMRVTDATVYLDITETTSNLAAIRENIAAREVTRAEKKPESTRKVVVNEITITGARLVPSSTIPGLDLDPVKLPEFSGSITDEEGGVTPEKAIAEVSKIVLRESLQTAARSGFIEGALEKKLNQAGEKLGITGGAVDSIKDSIRGLFGTKE